MVWKYSILYLPRLRWEQFGQWILSEQWNSVPSSAINTCPSRLRMASTPPRRSQFGHQIGEHGMEHRRVDHIELGAYLAVAGDFAHAE
jgi:hypothetical protein